jgi:hypothetical protein
MFRLRKVHLGSFLEKNASGTVIALVVFRPAPGPSGFSGF